MTSPPTPVPGTMVRNPVFRVRSLSGRRDAAPAKRAKSVPPKTPAHAGGESEGSPAISAISSLEEADLSATHPELASSKGDGQEPPAVEASTSSFRMPVKVGCGTF